jgi:trehalose-6-phosphate hydrolase
VRAELKKVCEFWADRGVDGLRLDVVNLISKIRFPGRQHGDGRRFYTDGPRVHEYPAGDEPRRLHPAQPDDGRRDVLHLAGNCQQYAALDGRELSMTFNFHHLKVDTPAAKSGRWRSRTSWR